MSSGAIPSPPQNASATRRGLMTAADKVALDAALVDIAALESSQHAAVTLGAVGSSPNANGASLATQVLTLQPASATQPGVVTAGTQTFGGAKTFAETVKSSNTTKGFEGSSSSGNFVLSNGATWGIWTNSGDVTMGFTVGNLTMLQLNGAAGRAIFSTYPLHVDVGFGLSSDTSAASPGNATINYPAGRSAIANGASTVTVTTSRLGTGDAVVIEWEGNHGQARHWVTYAAGSFTVNLSGNATGNTTFNWQVIKRY